MTRASLLPAAAALVVSVSACAEQATAPPAARTDQTEPVNTGAPTCVPHGSGHARVCGLAPPQRNVPGGAAHKATTITGESFWVTLSDEVASEARVMAVPGVPIRVNAGLTTAAPRAAADRYCDEFPECKPIVVSRRELRSRGVLSRWDDESRTIEDLEVTTLDIGRWTLVISEPDPALAERIARRLRWSIDEDGYPRAASTKRDVHLDGDWAGVTLWVPDADRQGEHYLIDVIPGCDLSAKKPDLGGSEDSGSQLERHRYGGRWCVDGRYWVDVAFIEPSRLELLHEKLTIAPTPRAP